MVELRKRKAPSQDGPPPAKKSNSAKSMPSGKKEVSSANGSASTSKVESGSTIDLENFGGEITTQEGVQTTLKKLGMPFAACVTTNPNTLLPLAIICSRRDVCAFVYYKFNDMYCSVNRS